MDLQDWSAVADADGVLDLPGLQALAGKRVVILAPHFLGLDAGGVAAAAVHRAHLAGQRFTADGDEEREPQNGQVEQGSRV